MTRDTRHQTSPNRTQRSLAVTFAAIALFLWTAWTGLGVFSALGPVLGAGGDAFVGQSPIVGLIGLGVMIVFGAAIVVLVGEAGGATNPVRTSDEDA